MKYSAEVSGIFALLTPPLRISGTYVHSSLQRILLKIQKCLKNTSVLLYIKPHISGNLAAE